MPASITLFGITVALGFELLVLFAVVFLAGIIRGFAGFGSAMITVPALAMLYGPAQAVVIEVLIEIPISIGLFRATVKDADKKIVIPMLSMFVLFVPIGALFLKVVDAELMKIIISVLVLVMVAIIGLQDRLIIFVSRTGSLVAGATSGIAQGMTGMSGPIYATVLLARGDSATVTRANILALTAGIISISVVSYIAVGIMTIETLIYATIATPSILLGTWVGSVLFKRLSHCNLRIVILIFLAVIAVATLTQTITDAVGNQGF